MIKEYAQQIQKALLPLGVCACLNKKENQVYSLSESPFGDIYCLYKQESECISSFAFFQPEVNPCDMEKVFSFLDELNRESVGGYFYIDIIQSKVAYCFDYDLSQGTETLGFELFCTHSYERMQRHRLVLYYLITGLIATWN